MRDVSRRGLLRVGAGLGVAGLVPQGALGQEDDGGDGHGSGGGHTSPHLEKYVHTLPIPERREPDGVHERVPYHEIPVEEAQHSFHPDLPDTTIWGFDGQFPGKIVEAHQHWPLAVEFDNSGLPDEHVFEIDTRIGGTTTENYPNYDGPVPDVRTVTHFHGLNVPPESDGQAEMWTSPGGVEGPRYSRAVQLLPNRQARMTSSYHDHARGITRLNGYAGLVGPYYIRGRWERFLRLPDGEYDVPLVLADRAFEEDGSLHYPAEFVPNFAGDTPTVNGAAWPYMEVEPRRYRFRPINLSNGRTYGLRLEAEGDSTEAPPIYQFSSGHGYLEEVATVGQGEDMERLFLAPFERADVIVDFSDHAGETLTLANHAAFPFGGGGGHDDGSGGGDGGGHGGSGPEIHEIMQFRVAESGGRHDWSVDPAELRLPPSEQTDPDDAVTTRTMTLNMEMGTTPVVHNLNGRHFGDPIAIEPELGTTEVWELVNESMHTHPIHIHLVTFDVIGRGPDGTEPPNPDETGPRDIVRVDPGETVRIAVEFGDYPGQYPFHCHVLEHEEHDMMRPFRVVGGDDDGDDRRDHHGWGWDDGDDHDGGWHGRRDRGRRRRRRSDWSR